MRTIETFFRTVEIQRESRELAAASYNITRVLYRRVEPDPLFVPIRSMQFLAVIDAEEFVFLDGVASRNRIELAWQRFRPQERSSLDAPVPYDVVFYTGRSLTVMPRLQSEFHRALRHAYERTRTPVPGLVVSWRGRTSE